MVGFGPDEPLYAFGAGRRGQRTVVCVVRIRHADARFVLCDVLREGIADVERDGSEYLLILSLRSIRDHMLQELVMWSNLIKQRQRCQLSAATRPVIKLDFDWKQFPTHEVFTRRMNLYVHQFVDLIAIVQYRPLVIDHAYVLSCVADQHLPGLVCRCDKWGLLRPDAKLEHINW